MLRRILSTIASASFRDFRSRAAGRAQAQDAKTPYPHMAPLDQYLMDRDAEIALARSAAPESISGDAEVMVLGRHGYETAVKGKNGFVCIVERSWTAPIDDPSFGIPRCGARTASTRRLRESTPNRHQEDSVGACRTIES